MKVANKVAKQDVDLGVGSAADKAVAAADAAGAKSKRKGGDFQRKMKGDCRIAFFSLC